MSVLKDASVCRTWRSPLRSSNARIFDRRHPPCRPQPETSRTSLAHVWAPGVNTISVAASGGTPVPPQGRVAKNTVGVPVGDRTVSVTGSHIPHSAAGLELQVGMPRGSAQLLPQTPPVDERPRNEHAGGSTNT